MKTALALLAALSFAHHVADAQITYEIVDCSGIEALSTLTEDAVLDFMSSPISCSTNTNTLVTDGITLQLTSSLEAVEFENLRFQVQDDSVLVSSLPNLVWQSALLEDSTVDDGIALEVESGGTATFEEDVTFDGCSTAIFSRGAVANRGTLTFEKTATIKGTTEGGGLFNDGTLEFVGDAVFQDNMLDVDSGARDGAGLFNDDGDVTFNAAASFIGNEVGESRDPETEGIFYNGGSGGGMATYGENVLFKGPVIFSGNKGSEGSGFYANGADDTTIIFEDSVTFENNIGTSVGDASNGGAMTVDNGIVEFQGDVTATGNVAKTGGAFFIDTDATVTIAGSVTMTGNEARYEGGAVWNEGTLSMPADAVISGNTAAMCPSIKVSDGVVELIGGSIFTGGSFELCYFGEDTTPSTSTVVVDAAAADCEVLAASGTYIGDYPTITLDCRDQSVWSLDVGTDDFEILCATQLIIFVTGGGEMTISSTAASTTFSNVRIEVLGYTQLIVNVPNLTMTGIDSSIVGGATFIDEGSSVDFMGEVKFVDNTLAFLSDRAWDEVGGGAMYSAGDVIFHEKATFSGNGQFEKDGLEVTNGPGGAIFTVGTMEFMKKATFTDNFDVNGGNGGAISNRGSLVFNLRAIFRRNTAVLSFSDDGETVNGHGPALYNYGADAVTVFKRKALFKDNVGSWRGCAVATNGGSDVDENRDTFFVEGNNKITFESGAFFKDNVCDAVTSRTQDTGGGGLWVYGVSTVEFQDRAVFRRNEAYNGGAIMNIGAINFASADLIDMTDNIGIESCPDIKNYDKSLNDHEYDEFGDIDDPDGICSCCGSVRTCTWYLGEVTIGDAETTEGEAADLCEFP